MLPETVLLHDCSRTDWADEFGPRPIKARIWVADESAGPPPLIVLSHGTGGAAEDLDWLAQQLNDSGYFVAAVDHHGNTYNGDYLAEGFAFNWERPRDISFLLDHVLATYNVDAARIGAAGFSIGGYTVAALLGARVDPLAVEAVMSGMIPAPALPEFPELTKAIRDRYDEAALSAAIADGAVSLLDRRICAGFVIAPAIGRLLEPRSLGSIAVPLEICWGEADDITPPEDNALVYLESIPTATGHSVGELVGHYDFLGDREDIYGARRNVAEDAVGFFASVL